MIKLDVLEMAAKFGQDPALIQAVEQAEGNIIRAVAISIPSVTTREKALDITCRSATHMMRDFIRAKGLEAEFVAAWGKRWAPVRATNDPTNLNSNWVRNVWTLWQSIRLGL